jgi:hypothetical protein
MGELVKKVNLAYKALLAQHHDMLVNAVLLDHPVILENRDHKDREEGLVNKDFLAKAAVQVHLDLQDLKALRDILVNLEVLVCMDLLEGLELFIQHCLDLKVRQEYLEYLEGKDRLDNLVSMDLKERLEL